MEELVSVVVVTYNSEETILETLESIYNQDYTMIELIVTDDHSTDDTVCKVKKWLKVHYRRFYACHVLVAKKNGGVVANSNRGTYQAKGKYIKAIAGDDILLDNCISLYMQYIRENPCEILFGKLECFGNRKLEIEIEKHLKRSYKVLLTGKDEIIKEFYLKNNFMPSPGVFFSKKLFEDIGGYDKRFPFWEDGPFYIKVVDKGYHIGFVNEYTVRYRMAANSLGHIAQNKEISYVGYQNLKSQVKYFYLLRLGILWKNGMYEEISESIGRMTPKIISIINYNIRKMVKRNKM